MQAELAYSSHEDGDGPLGGEAEGGGRKEKLGKALPNWGRKRGKGKKKRRAQG